MASQNRYSKSDSRENLSHFFYAHVQNTPSIRHFDAILTPSWQVSPALLTFRRHFPATKADVLLTFCTYKVLYAKKTGSRNYRGNLPGGVLMATMRCARRHAREHQHQRRRHGIGLLVDYLFCDGVVRLQIPECFANIIALIDRGYGRSILI